MSRWKNEKLRYLRAPKDKALNLVNGTVVETLDELSNAINLVTPETWEHHVRNGQHDLADWIDEAFGLPELSRQMRLSSTPLECLVNVEAFLRGIKQTRVH